MAHSIGEVWGREVAKSSCIRWGTNAPYAAGELRIERVGYADIPVIAAYVYCRAEDIGSIVPIVRAAVYQKLESHGLESEILEFTPTVGREGRQILFTNSNPDSPTCGKRKRGQRHYFRFEIRRVHIGHFRWSGRRGEFPA